MTRDTHTRSRWRLPQRSTTDRKLGGVAGGLGRAWRVDPILIRVAFVVLTIFGGSGVLLYCAGWLLMRGDGDDVSAVEALAGRGHSSVSPALSVVLIVVGLASMGSVFSWGIPFWPVVVGAVVLTVLLSQRHRSPHAPGRDAGQWADTAAQRIAQWGADVGERAAQWGAEMGERAGSWVDKHATQPRDSAADTDASAETAAGGSKAGGSEAGGSKAGGSEADGSKAGGSEAGAGEFATAGAASPDAASEADPFSTGRTPPAWDPLGAAPFAWDLPEPGPLAGQDADPEPQGRDRRPSPGSALARIFLGLALISGSLAAAGVASGWLTLPWAAVAGITLAILGIGLALAALRGRGGRLLIGPGVFVAVLTLALTVSGLTGTSGYGQQVWSPTTVESVSDLYDWNAGDATLDLSGLTIPAGETVRTDVRIGAGEVQVLLPADTTVRATCSTTVGRIDCLGQHARGVRSEHVAELSGNDSHGVLDIDVHSNAGQATVKMYE